MYVQPCQSAQMKLRNTKDCITQAKVGGLGRKQRLGKIVWMVKIEGLLLGRAQGI